MILNHPCIISSRLLPAVKIGAAYLSIEYGPWKEGRRTYRVYLDTPTFSYTDDTLTSGIGGGNLQEGLRSCLAFMGGCGESINYQARTGRAGENADLYPSHVAEWCADNDDEISMLGYELEENENLIVKS